MPKASFSTRGLYERGASFSGKSFVFLEPPRGFEPRTFSLRMRFGLFSVGLFCLFSWICSVSFASVGYRFESF